MSSSYAVDGTGVVERTDSWSGVFAMSLAVFVLIASEFMPISLLTPIAADLGVSNGQAGQAISVSAAFAVITSLFVSTATRRLNRKLVLLVLTGLMIISGLIVALAPTYPVFLLGRALIGVAIGGFWSMSAATVMRLVSREKLPRALAILNGGNALATVIAAPLGTYLAALTGWRGTFFCIVPVGVAVLIWQLKSLPSLPVERQTSPGAVFKLLTRPRVAVGMAAVSLLFAGQFALFTYVRPFLETAVGASAQTISGILLALGVAGLIGTALAGALSPARLRLGLIVGPAMLAAIAFALVWFGGAFIPTAILLCAWGLVATSAPVGWWAWLSDTLPGDAEAGGGLMVAIVQVAIALGAAVGGMLYDSRGYGSAFLLGAVVLIVAALLAIPAVRSLAPTTDKAGAH